MMVPKPQYKRCKAEKVQKIRLQMYKRCIFCGTGNNLQLHHVIFGNGRRSKSEKYGLVAWVCEDCHTGNNGLHTHPLADLELKQYAQLQFEGVYSREKWMAEFGKSYL